MKKSNHIFIILLFSFSFLGILFHFYFPPLKTSSFLILIIFSLLNSLCFFLYFSTHKKKQSDFSDKLANEILFKLKVQSLIEDKIPFHLCYLEFNTYHEVEIYLAQQEKDHVLSSLSLHLEKILNKSEICSIPIVRKKTSQLAYIKGGTFCFVLFSDNKKQTDQFLSSLLNAIPLKIELDTIKLYLQAELGVSYFDKYLTNSVDADILINQSQQALSHSKNNLSRFHYYDPADAYHHQFMVSLKNELENAIENNQFSLYHQAQYLLHNGAIYGSETLLRWHHPRFGSVSPAIFIPLAEKSGFIGKLTDWVLNKAFEQQAQILALGVKHRFSINVSALDISNPSFINSLCHLAKKHQVSTSLLSIELIESVNLKGVDCIQDTIKKLLDRNIKLSIDDYGTGYSSLFYLSQLPFSEIKIDKAFICTLTQDCRQQHIVKSTIEMANSLNLTLIAEGVEDKKTAQQLAKLGAKVAQGYYFSAPLRFEKYMRYLMTLSNRFKEKEKQQITN